MRELPPTRRLEIEFGETPFPAAATIAFDYYAGDQVSPGEYITAQAGRRGTWRIEFAPLEPLPQGAQIAYIKLEHEFRFAWRHQDYWPDARDYVSVEDEQGQPLPFICDTCLKSEVAALITLPREWASGEKVIIRLGDQRQGGAGSVVWPSAYEQARLACGVKLPGDAAFRPAPGALLSVRVVPCPPVKRYYLFAPSTALRGERIQSTILPVDINGNHMAEAADGFQEQPAQIRVEITRLRLEDQAHGLTAWSNPIRAVEPGALNVYWGEFHWHGYDAVELNILNANTQPEKAFRYGRDVTRLDFAGVGSHIFRQAPQAVHEWWELYREAARQVDQPGRYVPLLGCEWRDTETEGGDRNLIWRDLDAPAPDPTWRIAEIYERFRGQPAMVTPHVGGTIAMPYKHDPDVERLCEMVSGHGNSEWFAQAYLSKGYRVGMIGGSDGHRGTPGHPRTVSIDGGRFVNTLRLRDSGFSGGPLLAVCAERLDRESLWEAFRARRVYASSGARALLDFRANGAPMGSEISAARDVQFEIAIEGAAPIERVELIRDQSRLQRWEGGTLHFDAALTDRPPDGTHYYYLRVEQADGEMLWSSPIWVESSCGGTLDPLPAWNEGDAIDLAMVGDNPASAYLADLWRYLRTEENAEGFSQLTPIKIVHSPMGDYAVFFGYMRDHKIRIHWFFEFEVPRLRIEAGWVHFGAERILRSPWATPLFPSQDRM